MAFWHIMLFQAPYIYVGVHGHTHYTMQGDNDSIEADLHGTVLKVPRVIEAHFCRAVFISVLDD